MVRRSLNYCSVMTTSAILYQYIRVLIFFFILYSFRLFESGEYSDITFVVQGEAVPLHRCLLTARSEYFRDMLQSRWHSRDKVIINKDMVSHGLCIIPKYLQRCNTLTVTLVLEYWFVTCHFSVAGTI